MRQSLHLISMPMHDPLQPSAQLGYLSAHAKRELRELTTVTSYSAHFDVMWRWQGFGMRESYFEHRLFGEELFFLACCFRHEALFERAYAAYLGFNAPEKHVSREEVARLVEALEGWVDEVLVPALDPDALNVLGFTTTFSQVFASIFVCRRLAETPYRILPVFGGASVTVPETRKALELWGVEGILALSNGEAPLSNLIRYIAEEPENFAIIDRISEVQITNIFPIGADDVQMSLSLDRESMNEIGDPDYDEFFTLLERWQPNDTLLSRLLNMIALPVEGSRGCFAKCDFCQNPNMTSEFRTMSGADVADRVHRLHMRYGAGRIYFADSVCNSWSRQYSERMEDLGLKLPAFMELRVHFNQADVAALVRAGVNEVQLGIEAVAEPLLIAMRKGTRVWQNLRATKFLAEVGIRSVSNLITHHPRSTAADVSETRRIVTALRHLPGFSLSRFVLSYASPLWNTMSPDARASLPRGYSWLPEDLRPYSLQRDLAYPYPRHRLDPDATSAWDQFCIDYHEASEPVGRLESDESGRLVTDSRNGAQRTITLNPHCAAVLSSGHNAPRIADVAQMTDLGDGEVSEALDHLRQEELIVDLGERYLSLPLRPKSIVLGVSQDRSRSHSAVMS